MTVSKVDRGDVSYMEHERRNGNDVSQAVKNFVSNVLLNNDFIDAKKKPKVFIPFSLSCYFVLLALD